MKKLREALFDKEDRNVLLSFWEANQAERLLVFSPIFGGLLVFLITGLIGRRIYHGTPPPRYVDIEGMLMCAVMSLTGLITIKVGRVHGMIWPRGRKAAIVFGVLWMLVFWTGVIFLAWDYFFGPSAG